MVEPEYYVPILPMCLVNGSEGIGSGWSTKVPTFDPRQIVESLINKLDRDDDFA